MPIPARISDYLDSHHISYQSFRHPPAYTAQGIAQVQHISGKKLAKVVMVVSDDKKMIMTVVPASHRVDLNKLGRLLKTRRIRLATEEEFANYFPECELGAMPPLGNIYHLDVWVDEKLGSLPKISFNAGSHAETIQMVFTDFKRLVRPNVGSFAALLH
jgi:Ala-tRNA(Pro) deacylase